MRVLWLAIKFWTRAIELPFNSLVQQAGDERGQLVQRQLVMSGDKCWLSKLRTNESECGACFSDKYFSVPNFRGPCFRVSGESGDDVAEIRWEADFAKDCASIYDRKWWSEVSLVRQEVYNHNVSDSFRAKNSFDPEVRV